jgi:hypothetical protein
VEGHSASVKVKLSNKIDLIFHSASVKVKLSNQIEFIFPNKVFEMRVKINKIGAKWDTIKFVDGWNNVNSFKVL